MQDHFSHEIQLCNNPQYRRLYIQLYNVPSVRHTISNLSHQHNIMDEHSANFICKINGYMILPCLSKHVQLWTNTVVLYVFLYKNRFALYLINQKPYKQRIDNLSQIISSMTMPSSSSLRPHMRAFSQWCHCSKNSSWQILLRNSLSRCTQFLSSMSSVPCPVVISEFGNSST